MQAAIELGGYSASDSDDLRRAIAKKKGKDVIKHRKKFVKGAVTGGIPAKVAEKIFDYWDRFSHYGFNKSHAADYGVIAVQTGYLKLHYPVEYMTALLSAWKNVIDKVANYVIECRNMGIEVLPPDVSKSGYDFQIEDRPDGSAAIRFGLGAIKNVGQNPVDLILEAHKAGPFKDLTDFARRVDMRALGRRPLECLVKVGALDGFGSRTAILRAVDRIILISTSFFRAAEAGQLMLFNAAQETGDAIHLYETPNNDLREQLEWEKELLGLYVSDHPMNAYMEAIKGHITHFSNQLEETNDNEKVIVGGMVTRLRPSLTKTNKNMAFVTLEDIYGQVELVVFSRPWDNYRHLVDIDNLLIVEGRVDRKNGDAKVLVDKISMVNPDDLATEPGNPTRSEAVGDHVLDAYLPDIAVLSAFTEGENGVLEEDDDWADLQSALEADPQEEAPFDEQDDVKNDAAAGRSATDDGNLENLPLQEATEFQVDVDGDQAQDQGYYLIRANHEPSLQIQQGNTPPRKLVITLMPCGDKDRDVRRLRRIHGVLVSRPGKDCFAFRVFENDRYYMLDFPSDSTRLTDLLINKLISMMGDNNIDISPVIY